MQRFFVFDLVICIKGLLLKSKLTNDYDDDDNDDDNNNNNNNGIYLSQL